MSYCEDEVSSVFYVHLQELQKVEFTSQGLVVTLPGFNKEQHGTSHQDGGVGRHIVPPHKTKRRTTTNLKIKNNQNCQKIDRMEIQQPRS